MHTRIQLQEVGTNFIMKESMFTQLSTIIIIQQHAKWKSALLAVAADTPAQQQCCHTLQISHCTQFVALGWEQVPAEQLFSREKTAEASSKVKSYRGAVHELILIFMGAPAIVASHKLMRIYTGGLILYPSFQLNSFLWLVICSDNVAKWWKHSTADQMQMVPGPLPTEFYSLEVTLSAWIHLTYHSPAPNYMQVAL